MKWDFEHTFTAIIVGIIVAVYCILNVSNGVRPSFM